MQFIKLKARAKINLTLDVLGKREDGYHNVEMIMQTINLYDMITIKKAHYNAEKKIEVISNFNWLPCDDRNIAYKAADTLIKNYGIDSNITIELHKRIPVSAGLAGGSTDAAAVLFGMRKLFNLNIRNERLAEIGKSIGADIPFCLMRGTALATEIGDKLEPLAPCPNCFVLVVKPPINVSTASIYSKFDSTNVLQRPDTKAAIDAINKNDIHALAKSLCNVLESVTLRNYPVISELKNTMVEFGSIGALMSGSGPSVFGLFLKHQDAYNCAEYIRQKKDIRDIFITTMYNKFSGTNKQ